MKNGSIFQPSLDAGTCESYNLYCVIGVGDTLVLNYPFLGDAFPPTLVLCTVPSSEYGILRINSWAGVVLENYSNGSQLCKDKLIVPGSILIVTSYWDIESELMDIYKCGAMNNSIHKVMKKYGITEYSVPKVSKKSKYYSKYRNCNWFPFPN